jgi:hypothetical protein
MEERRIQLHPYLDAEIIEAVYRAVGVKAGGARKAVKGKGMYVCMYVCMYAKLYVLFFESTNVVS